MRSRLLALVPGAERLELTSFRHKPGLSAVMAWRLSGETGDVSVHGRMSTAGAHADVRGKWLERRESEDAAPAVSASFDDLHLVVAAFPHDRSIRGLPHLMNPDRLKRILHRSTDRFSIGAREVSGQGMDLSVVSIKPERHCVVRCEIEVRELLRPGTVKEVVYARADSTDIGEDVQRVTRELQASDAFGGAGAPIPRALGYDAERRISFSEAIPGRDMLGACNSGRFLDSCEWTGWFSSHLHSSRVRPSRRIRTELLLGACMETARTLHGAGLKEADLVLEVLHGLERAIPASDGRSCLHGDLHPGQVLAAAGSFHCLDLDAVGVGEPAVDQGYFLAHLRHLEIQGLLHREWKDVATERFLEGVKHGQGDMPREHVLRWHVDFSLVRLALNAVKLAHSGWRSHIEAYLQGALR